MIKNHHLLHLTEKEEFLKNEKLRIGKLYSKKHRKGFSNKDEFVNRTAFITAYLLGINTGVNR